MLRASLRMATASTSSLQRRLPISAVEQRFIPAWWRLRQAHSRTLTGMRLQNPEQGQGRQAFAESLTIPLEALAPFHKKNCKIGNLVRSRDRGEYRPK